MERTVKHLSEMNGRVYAFCEDKETSAEFLHLAESEGFTFTDGESPCFKPVSDLVAVNHDGTINYVGAHGRIAYQSNAKFVNGESLIRVNVKRYLSGDDDYII